MIGRRTVATRISRGALLTALAASATFPFLLLALWSVSRDWFYPALLPHRLTGDAWRLATSGAVGRAMTTSANLAVANGVIGCAVALPIGRALAGLRGWRRHVGAAAAFLPVAAPPIALGTGLQYFFLRLGLGGTTVGVLLAHLVPTVGFLSLYFLAVFIGYDTAIDDEARTLGASYPQLVWLVVLPLMQRQIAEAVALGFLVSWAQVALTLLVGEGVVRTLPLEVFAYVRAGEDRFAAAAALLLVVPPVLAFGAARLASRRTEVVFT